MIVSSLLLLVTLVTGQQSSSFEAVENAFQNASPVPFNKTWAGVTKLSHPESLSSTPGFVKVFKYVGDGNVDIVKLGSEARILVDTVLTDDAFDAVLFKGLPIATSAQFHTFWNDGGDEWEAMEHAPLSTNKRTQQDGIDLTTVTTATLALPVHNEMCYNPIEVSNKITFFCVTPSAMGGESILARNKDVDANIHVQIKNLIKSSGGIFHQRKWKHASRQGTDMVSWQDRAGTKNPEAAIAKFRDLGFDRVYFDTDETLHVENTVSGFHEDTWWNIAQLGLYPLANRDVFERDEVEHMRMALWKATYAIPLEAGDWMVVDNMRAMHGRLPYWDSEEQKRIMLATYTMAPGGYNP